jgi:hypothetical protein
MSTPLDKLTRRNGNGEQTYFLTAVADTTRHNGTPTRYAVWWTVCRTCHARFYVTSGLSSAALAKGPGNINCPSHRRRPGLLATVEQERLTTLYGAPGERP